MWCFGGGKDFDFVCCVGKWLCCFFVRKYVCILWLILYVGVWFWSDLGGSRNWGFLRLLFWLFRFGMSGLVYILVCVLMWVVSVFWFRGCIMNCYFWR